MARWLVCPQLIEKAKEWGMKIISIKDIIAYRLKRESSIEVGVEVDMPTKIWTLFA